MKYINLEGAWPILIVVILFLILPLSTLPGLFNLVFVILVGTALTIAVLIIITLLASRRSGEQSRSSKETGA